jgi:hypothetical protein
MPMMSIFLLLGGAAAGASSLAAGAAGLAGAFDISQFLLVGWHYGADLSPAIGGIKRETNLIYRNKPCGTQGLFSREPLKIQISSQYCVAHNKLVLTYHTYAAS